MYTSNADDANPNQNPELFAKIVHLCDTKFNWTPNKGKLMEFTIFSKDKLEFNFKYMAPTKRVDESGKSSEWYQVAFIYWGQGYASSLFVNENGDTFWVQNKI